MYQRLYIRNCSHQERILGLIESLVLFQENLGPAKKIAQTATNEIRISRAELCTVLELAQIS